MKGSRVKTNVLSIKMIPHADPILCRFLKAAPGKRSLGILTTDCDDVSYTALDEATKKANVEVVYAQSMYAGASNASTALAGEFIGIVAGENPEEVRSGLEAAVAFMEEECHFVSACDDDSVVYFSHCISRTGSFLSEQASVPKGISVAYLIAPPLEAMIGLDAALKAAPVELRIFYGPPTATNFAGGLLTGDQAACKAACDAFAEAVCQVAEGPLVY